MKHIFNWFKEAFTSCLNSKKSKFKGVRVAFTLAEGATHVAMLKNVRRCAFTLAEVLITLGIIGVVAALTLPTLIQNHQKQVYVTGLKKAYSNIQNAFSKAMLDEGVTEWRQSECYSNVALYDCTLASEGKDANILDNSNNCLNNLQKQFKGSETTTPDWGTKFFSARYLMAFTTSDGMIYNLDSGSISYNNDAFGWNLGFGIFIVDVNGKKGPNKFGRDKFVFEVDYDKNKIVPRGISGYSRCTTEAANNNSENAQYCTAKVIIEGKMNY